MDLSTPVKRVLDISLQFSSFVVFKIKRSIIKNEIGSETWSGISIFESCFFFVIFVIFVVCIHIIFSKNVNISWMLPRNSTWGLLFYFFKSKCSISCKCVYHVILFVNVIIGNSIDVGGVDYEICFPANCFKSTKVVGYIIHFILTILVVE